MSVLFQFKGKVENTEGLSGKDAHSPVYEAIASTPALDRDREVLLPRGVMIDNFMKNPVMLDIHDYRQHSVGKVLDIKVEKSAVKFQFQFADTESGRELRYLYDNEFMNAFSVGFYPRAFKTISDEDGEKVKLPVADDSEETVDLTKYEQRPRAIIHKWELLEISPVPVPSNPEALLRRSADLVVRKYQDSPALACHAKAAMDQDVGELLALIQKFTDQSDEFELRGPVRSHTTPIDFEASWDGQKARAGLARWASSDGSGKKEEIDFAKFARGFSWFDSAAADTLGAYKLPHHVVRDGELVSVFRGVTAAMGALLGARGGADIPTEDRRTVYDHLARHYRDGDREAPEFREVGEYNDEALKAIEDGEWEAYKAKQDELPETCEPTVGEDADGKPSHTCPEGFTFNESTGMCERKRTAPVPDDDKTDDNAAGIKLIIKRVDDLENELDVRLSILGDLIEEVSDAVRAIKKGTNDDDETAADGGKGGLPKGDEDNVTDFKIPDDLTESLDKLTGTNG